MDIGLPGISAEGGRIHWPSARLAQSDLAQTAKAFPQEMGEFFRQTGVRKSRSISLSAPALTLTGRDEATDNPRPVREFPLPQ